jgi:hypothetical protein
MSGIFLVLSAIDPSQPALEESFAFPVGKSVGFGTSFFSQARSE